MIKLHQWAFRATSNSNSGQRSKSEGREESKEMNSRRKCKRKSGERGDSYCLCIFTRNLRPWKNERKARHGEIRNGAADTLKKRVQLPRATNGPPRCCPLKRQFPRAWTVCPQPGAYRDEIIPFRRNP